MATEVKVPVLPESVSDATIASWHKKAGEAVKRDENLVDLKPTRSCWKFLRRSTAY